MEDIDRNRARWSLTLSDRVTSSLSVGREREEVGPGTKAIHQDPDFRATGRARSEFSCPGILMLSSVLFFFFVSSSSSTFSSLSPPPLLRSSLVHHSTSTGVSSLLIRSTFQSSRIKPGRDAKLTSATLILCLIGFLSLGNFHLVVIPSVARRILATSGEKIASVCLDFASFCKRVSVQYESKKFHSFVNYNFVALSFRDNRDMLLTSRN